MGNVNIINHPLVKHKITLMRDEKPVPPPDLWMSAAFFTVSKIASMLSSTGSTKQAESCPRSVPAFMSVGEFGMNKSSVMIS